MPFPQTGANEHSRAGINPAPTRRTSPLRSESPLRQLNLDVVPVDLDPVAGDALVGWWAQHLAGGEV